MMMKDFAVSMQLVELCDLVIIEGVVVKWNISGELNELDKNINSTLQGENPENEGLEKEKITARMIEHLQNNHLVLIQNNNVAEVYSSRPAFELKEKQLEKINDIEEVKIILIEE